MPTSTQRLIGVALIATGIVFLVGGLAVGAVVDPIWASIAVVGVSDIVFGAMFMTGRIGATAEPRARDADAAEPKPRAEESAASPYEPDPRAGTDPEYNPYVRDD